MNEFDWIDWIRRRAVPPPRGWVGIGDDAAVFPAKGGLVASTDTIVDGIDFDAAVAPGRAGRKALAINLSDLAAMGAAPTAFLLTLGVPPAWNGPRLRAFVAGLLKLAREYRLPCLGGDLTSAGQFFCSLTIFGAPPPGGALLRSGARPGDRLFVTGRLGGSILGRHCAFRPRVEEAQWLARHFRPSAMLDVSDGLAQDLGHLLRASGCAARLDLERIPVSADARRRHGPPERALLGALADGEDFELLFAVRTAVAEALTTRWKAAFPRVRLTGIGRIEAGRPAIRWFRDGERQPDFIAPAGYRHF